VTDLAQTVEATDLLVNVERESAGDEEDETDTGSSPGCAEAVQGEIAWDYSGSTRWAATNVERLCSGAEDSDQPARCFDRVMHDGIDWGGGTRWRWKNALNLCRGTLDADATINCFERKIARGVSWQKAIPQCQWDRP
jgi:hypothetical protein